MTEYFLRAISLDQFSQIKECCKVGAASRLLHIVRQAGDTAELGVLVVVFLAILVSSIEPIGLRHRCRFLREMQPGSLFQGQQENT
jgi:hypothetical protein